MQSSVCVAQKQTMFIYSNEHLKQNKKIITFFKPIYIVIYISNFLKFKSILKISAAFPIYCQTAVNWVQNYNNINYLTIVINHIIFKTYKYQNIFNAVNRKISVHWKISILIFFNDLVDSKASHSMKI